MANILSNPVTVALDATGSGTRYDVGPGQTLTHPNQVPWSGLVAGDVVNIHYDATEYVAKFAIHGRGTALNHIIINGVTDASGNRPRINGQGATTPATTQGGANPVYPTPAVAGTEAVGVVTIRRGPNDIAGYLAGYITLQNLDIYGADQGNTFTQLNGGTGTYGFSASIYGRAAEQVLVQNCLLHNSTMGVFTMVNGPGLYPSDVQCYDWTFRGCRIYEWGTVGSDTVHGFYIQGVRFITEYCFLGQGKVGAGGSSVKSRVGLGEIIRYNWIVAHARALDLVEMEEQMQNETTPWTDSILYGQDQWIDRVYGNVIINDEQSPRGLSWRPIHYGADNLGEQNGPGAAVPSQMAHRKRLLFWNNTLVSRSNGAGASQMVFHLSLQSTVCDAWNNTFHFEGNIPLNWLFYAGTLNLSGNNVVYRTGGTLSSAMLDATAGQFAVNQLGTALSGNPLLTSLVPATRDMTPLVGSSAIDAGGAAPAGVPTDTDTVFPIQYSPASRLNGAVGRAGTTTLGAFEFGEN